MRIVKSDSASEVLIEAYEKARKDLDLAQSRLKGVEAAILDFMEDHQRKTIAVVKDGKQFTATYTQRNTNKIDEKGLRKALSARVYDQYTKKVLDRKKLEVALSDGEVDPTVVARFVEQVPGARFLTYRVKDDNAAEGV
jgi:predicted CopG family antitoxin